MFLAEIPSIRLQSKGQTADECISGLKRLIEELVNEEGFECRIDLEAGSVFHVKSEDSAKFERFLLRLISERSHGPNPTTA